MNSDFVNLDELFDADEYMRSGHCPWTFFAYPTTLADSDGLPPDEDACRLLGKIQARGIDVAVWVNGMADNTTYFACRHEDVERLNDSLVEFQRSGSIPDNFCAERSEQLFGQVEEHAELTVEEVVEIEGRGTVVFFTKDPEPFWPQFPQHVRITLPNGDTCTATANVEFARKVPPGEVMSLLFPALSPDQIPAGSKVTRTGNNPT